MNIKPLLYLLRNFYLVKGWLEQVRLWCFRSNIYACERVVGFLNLKEIVEDQRKKKVSNNVVEIKLM